MIFSFTAAAVDLVSVPDPSLTPSATGDSYMPIVSADGRYILFGSTANNLVTNSGNRPYQLPRPAKMNVFLRDRVQGTTALVTADPTDTTSGEEDSIPTAISTNGQYALFEGGARDLVTGDPNGKGSSQVFVRDVVNKTTTLVTVSRISGGANMGGNESTMTPDGRYVAFTSKDNTLVQADANAKTFEVFVRDLVTSQTRWVSAGMPGVNPDSDSPVMTPDGRFVAFLSLATSPNPTGDVYVSDLNITNTVCVSSNSHKLFSGFPICYGQKISDNGRFVAFQISPFTAPTTAYVVRHDLQTGADVFITSNAIPISANPADYRNAEPLDMSPDGRFVAFVAKTNANVAVYLWDAQTATTTVASFQSGAPAPSPIFCDSPSVDASGRFVSFFATGSFLVPFLVVDSGPHLYRNDVQTHLTKLIDVSIYNNATNRTINSDYSMSADGRFVAFDSPDVDLVPQNNNNGSDVFVRDLTAGTTELVSVPDASLASKTIGVGPSRSGLHVSTDGRYATFISPSPGLVADSTNRFRNVIVRDLVNQSNFVADLDTNGLGNADGMAMETSISSDGRYVAFTSWANNLVSSDSNHVSDVFLRDLQTGKTVLVSTNGAGPGSASGASSAPIISSDGRYVTYFSTARNIVALPDAISNVFQWDEMLGKNYALTTNGTALIAVTPDSRYVAYFGLLVGGGVNIYLWDTQLHQRIYTNSVAPGIVGAMALSTNGQWLAYTVGSTLNQPATLKVADRIANSNITVSTGFTLPRSGVRLSDDGRYLVYATTVSNAPPDVNGKKDVYVFDMQTRSNLLVSRSFFTGKAATGISDFPDISSDGRFIVFQSDAADIVPSDNNHNRDVFLFDQLTGSTVLLSADAYGSGSGDYISQAPSFTGDGQTLAFQTWSSDLTENDFNQGSDLFLLRINSTIGSGSTNPPPVISGQVIFNPGSGPGSGQIPQLTWAATPGTSYQVVYKDELTDPDWLPVNGTVVVEGGQGYAKDLASNPDHRFYRIVAY